MKCYELECHINFAQLHTFDLYSKINLLLISPLFEDCEAVLLFDAFEDGRHQSIHKLDPKLFDKQPEIKVLEHLEPIIII